MNQNAEKHADEHAHEDLPDRGEMGTGARRLKTLRVLGDPGFADATTTDEVCRAAAGVLADNPHDVPFALIYLLDANGKQARLAETVTLAAGTSSSSTLIDLGSEHDVWIFHRVIESNQSQILDCLAEWFRPLPAGLCEDNPPQCAYVLPLGKGGVQHLPSGFLVAGFNPAWSLPPGIVASSI